MEGDLVNVLYGRYAAEKTVQVHVEVQVQVQTAHRIFHESSDCGSYEGANHAFNNDTNTARYNKEAADLAWGRTLKFLRKYLGA